MHKLTRSSAPRCLRQYQHGHNNWNDVTRDHKNEIWLKINDIQQSRCAYCEQTIKTAPDDCNAHLEHFRQRNQYPQGTFSWDNIFGSCNREDSCGKHKDKQLPYEHTNLIKMDVEDPENLLTFLPNGNIVPSKELNARDTHRAEETIRIFNLNGSLRHIRERAIKGYIQTAEEISKFANFCPEEEWRPILLDELDKIKLLPFSTAIKHILQPRSET